MTAVTHILVAALTAAILGWLYRSALRSRAQASQGRLIFGGSAAIKGTMIFCCLFILGLVVMWRVMDENWRQHWWVGAFFLLLAAATPFGIPPEIVVADHGLSSSYWWGHQRQMRWDEVQEIRDKGAMAPLMILGANGAKIVHTYLNVDRARFLAEVRQRTQGFVARTQAEA